MTRPALPLALTLVAAALLAPTAHGQPLFESSNLPILVIETGGVSIPDEPKIPARLGVVDNGPGQRNYLSDPFNGYDGDIGIEIRGSTSQRFPKKAYSVETREADGSNNNVELLGLPRENDWVLHGPYSDKSLMRNAVAFGLARQTGQYASRARFCEVVIDGDYRGVYLLLEAIKKDGDRVDIATLNEDESEGDDLTGGYIIKIDKYTGANNDGWRSVYYTEDYDVEFQYHYPEPDDITPAQKAYIQGVVADFEELLAGPDFDDPDVGYASAIDVGSFVDYFLLTELTKNIDGYRVSTYFHKDKDSNGGRLTMGPVWDFNLAAGNVDFAGGQETQGYQYDRSTTGWAIPFWWARLLESPTFARAVNARWAELRGRPFHADSIDALIDAQADLLAEAQARNFERWPILGVDVWPNAFVGDTYPEEVDYLKRWLRGRGAWLDANLGALVVPADSEAPDQPGGRRLWAYPNPTAAAATVRLDLAEPGAVAVRVVDALGRTVRLLHEGALPDGPQTLRWDARGLSAGLYLVVAEAEGFRVHAKVAVVRP